VVCKPLREDREQSELSFEDLTETLRGIVDTDTNQSRGTAGG